LLGVEVVGLTVRKYSSSACVNMRVASTNRLSPRGRSGVWVWGVDKGGRGHWEVWLPGRAP